MDEWSKLNEQCVLCACSRTSMILDTVRDINIRVQQEIPYKEKDMRNEK